MSAGKS